MFYCDVTVTFYNYIHANVARRNFQREKEGDAIVMITSRDKGDLSKISSSSRYQEPTHARIKTKACF